MFRVNSYARRSLRPSTSHRRCRCSRLTDCGEDERMGSIEGRCGARRGFWRSFPSTDPTRSEIGRCAGRREHLTHTRAFSCSACSPAGPHRALADALLRAAAVARDVRHVVPPPPALRRLNRRCSRCYLINATGRRAARVGLALSRSRAPRARAAASAASLGWPSRRVRAPRFVRGARCFVCECQSDTAWRRQPVSERCFASRVVACALPLESERNVNGNCDALHF